MVVLNKVLLVLVLWVFSLVFLLREQHFWLLVGWPMFSTISKPGRNGWNVKGNNCWPGIPPCPMEKLRVKTAPNLTTLPWLWLTEYCIAGFLYWYVCTSMIGLSCFGHTPHYMTICQQWLSVTFLRMSSWRQTNISLLSRNLLFQCSNTYSGK